MAGVQRLRDLGEGRRDTIMIPPRNIEIEEGHNPRNYHLEENRAHLEELKASIKANGTLQPLLVRFDVGAKKAFLVDGECRLRANLELMAEGIPIESIPCLQVPAGNESERLLLALTANTGKPLSKWEVGSAYVKLVRFGWTNEKIAQRMGQSVRYIAEAIELNDAPEEVKQMLSEQAITPSLAISELRKQGEAATATLRAKASKAKTGGKPAKREKNSKRGPLLDVVEQLLASADEKDMENTDRDTVKVSKVLIRKLMKYKR